MKKLFLIGAFACASISTQASVVVVTTCGRSVVVPGQGSMSDAEWESFLRDINWDMCRTNDRPLTFEYAPGDGGGLIIDP